MHRDYWKQLAEERMLDALALLKTERWSSAYYIAGYAAECGLKACILAFVEENAEIIFRERKFSEKCWVHDLNTLVEQAGMGDELRDRVAEDQEFATKWAIVEDWKESSRYELKSQADAEQLIEAMTHEPNPDISSAVLRV